MDRNHMTIIISGGNFTNKGAEAMIFTAFVECSKMFGHPKFILQLPEGFCKISSMEELIGLSKSNGHQLKAEGKTRKVLSLLKSYRKADAMLDISGLELSSKLGCYPTLRYIFKIAISKWMGTKVFLMPQSFGPFDYGKGIKQLFMTTLIRHYLTWPSICYAREKDGEKLLKKISPKANVVLSSDLVLQNKDVEGLLKRSDMELDKLPLVKENSVAIVPNRRMYEQYGKEKPLITYKEIISYLRKRNVNVYILCHADELPVAVELKSLYENDDRVILIEGVLSCFQYQSLVRSFNFIVASRYHAIVHAFKENTPVIALGWAIKYRELLKMVGQDKYLLSVDDTPVTMHNLIDKLITNYKLESNNIKMHMAKIQQQNCFLPIKDYLQ